MPELKAQKTTYSYSLEEMKKLIAVNLNVPEVAVSVEYVQTDVSDDRFSRSSDYRVTSIEVSIDNTKIK